MNSDGTDQRYLASNMFQPDWSPDGNVIVASGTTRSRLSNEIFLISVDGSTITDISNHEALDWFPRWSPDGTQIVFTSLRRPAQAFDIFVMNADGSDQRRITTFDGFDSAPVWSSP
jgi:TolB protein